LVVLARPIKAAAVLGGVAVHPAPVLMEAEVLVDCQEEAGAAAVVIRDLPTVVPERVARLLSPIPQRVLLRFICCREQPVGRFP
jgi:hypothetical protein